MPSGPARGDVWVVNLDPVIGHEQAGARPAVVISADLFNRGPAGLAVVVPMTRTYRGIPLHVRVAPPDGGVREVSYVKVEDIRSVSIDRFIARWGTVSSAVLQQITANLAVLLDM